MRLRFLLPAFLSCGAIAAGNPSEGRPRGAGTFPHVLVNGVPVLRDGKHTGAMPGRIVRPGK